MNVLFLDVDGVLNRHGSGGLNTLTRSKLRLLEHIVRSTGCEIVVSSTWRILPETRKVLRKKLGYRDITIFGWTPQLVVPGRKRGDEIDLWLRMAQIKGIVVENIAILDDDSDFLPEQEPVLVQTNGWKGMSEEDAEAVIRLLLKEPKLPMVVS